MATPKLNVDRETARPGRPPGHFHWLDREKSEAGVVVIMQARLLPDLAVYLERSNRQPSNYQLASFVACTARRTGAVVTLERVE